MTGHVLFRGQSPYSEWKGREKNMRHTSEGGDDIRLWSYVLRKAVHSLNDTTKANKEKCPMEIQSIANVTPNPNHEHPFGCPMYVYQDHGSLKAEKWEIDQESLFTWVHPPNIHAAVH
jgi:hypothetical protein